MAEARQEVPFEFVLMLGDNLYGVEDTAPSPADYECDSSVPTRRC